ncbi:DUF4422 domain-containing protein [Clostridium perfringens]|nr:DUF4422 domain-containing protein [Clostridium perfringens]
MNNIEILVATHKQVPMPNEEIYIPIHVGRQGKKELGYIGDNTGENISLKNPNYCELTALYWYLKNKINNDSIKYVGLNHYRRYFLPDVKEFENSSIVRINFQQWQDVCSMNKGFINKALEEYDAILPKKRVYPISVKSQYSTMHIKEHLLKVVNIISNDYPSYLETTKKYLNQNKSHLYNMFIIKKEHFIKMMEWIFDILFKLEKEIEIPSNTQQARVFGFLSERLVNIYIINNNIKVKELPVAFITDNLKIECDNYKNNKNVNNFVFNIGNKLWDYIFFNKNIKIKSSKSKK